ncbi:MAG: deoxyribodipyrimidine photo-lyase [Thermomonas sp.]
MNRGLFWFRRDLRLADHPALERACQSHDALLLVYVDDDAQGVFDASRAWLRHSLELLGEDIRQRGGELHVLVGDPEALIPALAVETGATAVHISALHEPDTDARDARIAATLAGQGIAMRRASGRLLTDADAVLTQSSTPFRVFTPFHKTARPTWRHRPRAAPERLDCVPLPSSMVGAVATIEAPRPRWDTGFWETWSPGEAAALARLDDLLPRLAAYPDARDVPAVEGTSRLSPHLHFGEIHPGRIFDVVQQHGGNGADKYIAELGWREFAYYVLHHWPASIRDNFNPKFDAMPWRDDPAGLEAWRRGRTGVPLVDAGLRQLWHEGWMHSRVRMVVASYLTKHMGIDWRQGAAWFMHTLVDADLANNTLGWQWVAGTGVDAAPYFRIFNPVTQSRRFDPQGSYIRRWVPELRGLGDAAVHAPWEQGLRVEGYPAMPIVDLSRGRDDALARLAALAK